MRDETYVPSKTGALGTLKEFLPKLSTVSFITPAPGIKVFPLATRRHHSLEAVGGGGTEDWLLKAPLPIPTEPKPAAPAEERSTADALGFKPRV